mgnify:CR=1 FL=1
MRTQKNIGTCVKGGLERTVGQLGQLRGQVGGISRRAITIGLLGVAAVSLAACYSNITAGGNNFPEYHFRGELDGERVTFNEDDLHPSNSYLTAQKPGGTIVTYVLLEGSGPDHTLELEKVAITEDGKRAALFSADSPNQEVKSFMETAEKDVGKYLESIMAAKTGHYNPQAPPAQKVN